MSKQRISHCNKENVGLLENLKNRIESLKQKPIEKQKPVKQQSEKSIVQGRSSAKIHRTPKKLVKLKLKARYAGVPARKESKLLQFVIRKEVEEFKQASRNSRKKVKIAAYNGSTKQSEKINTIKCDQNV